MSRAKRTVPFRQIDITRAVRAALAGGLNVIRTEISSDGRIVLIHGDVATASDNPFDQWKQHHAR